MLNMNCLPDPLRVSQGAFNTSPRDDGDAWSGSRQTADAVVWRSAFTDSRREHSDPTGFGGHGVPTLRAAGFAATCFMATARRALCGGAVAIVVLLFGLAQAHAQTCVNNLPASNPTSAYTVHGNGTVTDTRSGLMWKVCTEGKTWGAGSCSGPATTHNWAAALALAEGTVYAGQNDWRLPNVKELRSLVEECAVNPAINTAIFPSTDSSLLWSGSPFANNSSYAWVVGFNYGFASIGNRIGAVQVRLVRGGQSFGNLVSVAGVSGAALIDAPTLFTVSGTGLTAGLGFSVEGCTPSNAETVNASSSSAQRFFTCTPRGAAGARAVVVRTSPAGAVLWRGTAAVNAPAASSYPARFVFNTAIGNQTVGTPFNVQISARDAADSVLTTFHGIVRLADSYGKTISLNTAVFANGVFTGPITAFTAGRTQLLATSSKPDGALISGQSTPFDTAANSPRNSTLTIKTGVVNANVAVTRNGNPYGSNQTTDAAGLLRLSAVPFGEYRVAVTKSGWTQASHVNQNIMVDKDLDVRVDMQASGKRPVVVVPGVMGSTLRASTYATFDALAPRNFGDHFVGASPKLPKKQCAVTDAECELLSDLEIYDPTLSRGQRHSDNTAMGSALLTQALEANFSVFAAPWDWRHTVSEARKIYLKKHIDRAKQATGYLKVDVVAHSMGGLLTRDYIQSADYADDIDRFIMIGTPNRGSANAYYLMEGGQALELDSLIGDASSNGFADAAFYAGAANELHRTVYGTDIYTLSSDNDVQNDSELVKGKTSADVKTFFNDNAPGGRELLPTYNFLRQWTATWGSSDKTDFEAGTLQATPALNSSVSALNASANVSRFKSMDFIGPLAATEVRTHIFLSNSEKTFKEVGYSVVGSADQYPLGIPNYHKNRPANTGDGTVLTTSGLAGLGLDNTVGAFGSHPYMFGALRTQVVQKLTQGRTFPSASAQPVPDGLKSTTVPASVPSLVVGLSVEASVIPLLTAPNGLQAGTVASTGAVFETIPNSQVDSQRFQNRINLTDPVNGLYSLRLAADAALNNTSTRVTIDFATQSAGSVQNSVRYVRKPADRLIGVQVATTASRAVQILDNVGVPTQLRARRSVADAMTSLTWTRAADAAVAGYRIYSRPLAASVFTIEGNVGATAEAFDSSRAWGSSIEDEREFVVVSVSASGEESLIRSGNATTNRSYVAVKFSSPEATNGRVRIAAPLPVSVSFVDESSASDSITDRAWDFNTDGVAESTIQNPTFVFPSYGSFSVNLKVTTPEMQSQRTVPNFVKIVPCAPLTTQATCTLDVNGDGEIDVTDGVLILRRLMGFKGGALTAGLVSSACAASPSTAVGIANFIDHQVAGGHYNVDGQPGALASATSAGMLIVRALQGLTETQATQHALRPGATRTAWAGNGQIREYLAATCGATLRD
ncbi:MAG: DUF1566 domain-containing protein [Betaproteobacteria bacterium]|nr:MAG: DUF1566 domain-containing protein [Betaproteobacteria bacterium]